MINLKAILNLLLLLNEEPKGMRALYKSGCFSHWKYLHQTMKVCLKAGLIDYECIGRTKVDEEGVFLHRLHKGRFHRIIKYFYITSLGCNLLSFYDGCQIEKVNMNRRVS